MKTLKNINLLFLLSVLGFASCQSTIDKPIEGKIKRNTISVTGKIPGRVHEIRVHEGEFVKAGDTLAILSLPEVDAKMVQAEGAVKSADAQYKMTLKGATDLQLQQLAAKRDALQEQYKFAQTSVKRLSNMLQDSLISRQQYDEAYTKMQGAKAQYMATLAEFEEAKNGARVEQQIMALGQKDRAEGALQEAGAADKERYIIAPQDMSIENITLSVGELALPGYTLFTGYLNSSTYFRFTLPESKIGQVKNGQEVTIEISYAKTSAAGTIISISQLTHYADITTAYPDYEMGEAIYEIKVKPGDENAAKEFLANATVTLKL